MKSLLVLAITAVFMLAALRSSYIAMLLYWWFGIFRPQDRIWWDVSSLRLPLIAAAIFVVPTLLRGFYPQVKGGMGVLIVLWLLCAAAAHFGVGCGNYGPLGNATMYMLILIFVVLLSMRVIETPFHIALLAATISVPFGIFSGKSGIDAILGGGQSNYGASNFTGIFSGSNAYALGSGMLSFFMLLSLQLTKSPDIVRRFPSLVQRPSVLRLVQLMLVGMILGTLYYIMSLQSRGSSIATFGALFMFAYLNKVKMRHFLLAIPVCLLALLIVPLPAGYEERIKSAFADKEELDTSAQSRPHFWGVAVRMVSDNPLGVGPGCYPFYYEKYDTTFGMYGVARSVHSSHFQVLSETGFAGFAVWILLFVMFYLCMFRARSYAMNNMIDTPDGRMVFLACNAIICSQTVFVLGGSFYELAFSDLAWLNFGFAMALAKMIETYRKKASNLPGRRALGGAKV